MKKKIIYLFIKIIIFYQNRISIFLNKKCKFYLNCSQYMIIAILKHGLIKGIFFGIVRILKCNFFLKGGINAVPDKKIKF